MIEFNSHLRRKNILLVTWFFPFLILKIRYLVPPMLIQSKYCAPFLDKKRWNLLQCELYLCLKYKNILKSKYKGKHNNCF